MKRFTDTDKWTKNKWFRTLPVEYRLFWLFVVDTCDMVGVYEVDIDMFNTSQGCNVNAKDAVEYFGNRIKPILGGRKWWVISFCRYQYGELKEDNIKNKPHQRYICELKNHRLWIDYKKTINSLEEKEKDKEKDKDKEEEKETEQEQEILVPENSKFSALCMADEMNFIAPLTQKLSNTDFEPELLPEYFEEFNNHLKLTAAPQKEYQDYRTHFINWITRRAQSGLSMRTDIDPNGVKINRYKHPNFPKEYPYTYKNIYFHERNQEKQMKFDDKAYNP